MRSWHRGVHSRALVDERLDALSNDAKLVHAYLSATTGARESDEIADGLEGRLRLAEVAVAIRELEVAQLVARSDDYWSITAR